jgi:uncharacterized protein YbjT (DUF2867 family)
VERCLIRRVTIIGARGTLGREATRELIAAGWNVTAATRDPDRAGDLKRLGADVRKADLLDPPSMRAACRGSDAVFAAAHSMLGRGRSRSEVVDDVGHRALIDAAKAEGVRHFVYTSILGASPDHPIDFWRTKYAVERHLEASGLSYTILRPSAFMDTHGHEFLGKSILRSGRAIVFGSGDKPMNFVAVEDVARLALLALGDPQARGKTIEIGGPENLSKNEVAAMYARLSGRKVKVVHLPASALRLLSTLTRPIHPGVSRVLRAGAVSDHLDERFDAGDLLKMYPLDLTRMEDFVGERVAEWNAGQ